MALRGHSSSILDLCPWRYPTLGAWPGRGAQLPRELAALLTQAPNTASHDYVQLPWTRRQHTYITDNLGSMRACGNRHENPGLLTRPYSGCSAPGRIRLCALGRIRMRMMDQGILEGADGRPGVPLCYHCGIRPVGLKGWQASEILLYFTPWSLS